MININELEAQWKAYKKRQKRPFIYAILVLLTLSITIIVLWPHKELPTHKKNIIHKPITTKKEPSNVAKHTKKTQTVPQEKSVVPIQAKPIEKVQELKPSFGFIRDINTQRNTHSFHKASKNYQNKKAHANKKVSKIQKRDQKSNPITNEKQSHSLQISHDSQQDKIRVLINRFNQSKNPKLGIAIAQAYYDKKNYKKAYYYALETNGIDQNNEESWLIASKSLYFLHKRNDAMVLLKTYLMRSYSSKGTKLLNSMQTGKLIR